MSNAPLRVQAHVQNTALAAILVFSDRALYPSYAGGGSPLDDQAAAGALMWVPMSLAYVVPAVIATARWLSPATGAHLRIDRTPDQTRTWISPSCSRTS